MRDVVVDVDEVTVRVDSEAEATARVGSEVEAIVRVDTVVVMTVARARRVVLVRQGTSILPSVAVLAVVAVLLLHHRWSTTSRRLL